ncbi:hypothetical protein STEG23_024786 [Scotinomys teguina]
MEKAGPLSFSADPVTSPARTSEVAEGSLKNKSSLQQVHQSGRGHISGIPFRFESEEPATVAFQGLEPELKRSFDQAFVTLYSFRGNWAMDPAIMVTAGLYLGPVLSILAT